MEDPPIHYYSPNDYIYKFVDSDLALNDDDCNKLENTVSCGVDITGKSGEDIIKCIKKEYCINKKYAINDSNNLKKHLGAEGRFLDTKSEHDNLLEITMSYSIGLLGVIAFLFLNLYRSMKAKNVKSQGS
jgi:hypothetical protein